jgi:hypothetical protein
LRRIVRLLAAFAIGSCNLRNAAMRAAAVVAWVPDQ